jgi:hypothetical protein
MALGGGIWTTQNKILPGAYINFISAANTDVALSDRGIATVPVSLDWGEGGKVFSLTTDRFTRDAFEWFGYDYDAPELTPIRELFKHARKVFFYRVNGEGVKASNTVGKAKYPGTRGNDIKITVAQNVDNTAKFDVTAYLGTKTIDHQTVASAAELVDNDFIEYDRSATLKVASSTPMTGGTNSDVTTKQYSDYLSAMESYAFNTMGVASTDDTVKKLVAAYVRRMRDTVGKKFQVVLYRYAGDYEGIISVENQVTDSTNEANAVYWVTGAEAGCSVSGSVMNMTYDGEYAINVDYKQSELKDAIGAGKFMFHRVGDEVRVLMDLNTLKTFTVDKGEVFQDNQTIRVTDQIANGIAALFNNKYLGKVPNDEAGRSALWVDLCKYHDKLMQLRAIEGFTDKDITVSQGADKRSVVVGDNITVVNTMAKLYMAVVVA